MRRLSLLWLIPLLLAASLAGLALWAANAPDPMPEALAALQSDAQVLVRDNGPWIEFTPAGSTTPAAGLILYPGGRVDPRSYAPLARTVASAGYRAVIVPMPVNLAIIDSNRAADVIQAYPETDRWVIGGHSLGGAMAARFTLANPSLVDGLLLLAAFPAKSDSLAGTAIPVTSVYATLDGLATPAEIEASRPLLPAAASFVAIEGGNHAGFGWYGEQAGDNPARIPRAEQQAQVLNAALLLLRGVSGN